MNFSYTPIFIVFTIAVLIALVALTMRAVVRRDRAMINAAMDKPNEIAAYQQRWRNAA